MGAISSALGVAEKLAGPLYVTTPQSYLGEEPTSDTAPSQAA